MSKLHLHVTPFLSPTDYGTLAYFHMHIHVTSKLKRYSGICFIILKSCMKCLKDRKVVTMMKAMFCQTYTHDLFFIKLQALPTFVSLFPNKNSNGRGIVNVPGIQ
jgi:hypothetical protein